MPREAINPVADAARNEIVPELREKALGDFGLLRFAERFARREWPLQEAHVSSAGRGQPRSGYLKGSARPKPEHESIYTMPSQPALPRP